MINRRRRGAAEGLKETVRSWVRNSLRCLEMCLRMRSPAGVSRIRSSGLLKMQLFISEPCSQRPTHCFPGCPDMLSVMVSPISTLNAITTMRTVPSSARGGLAFAIKRTFRFWLITGEECDSGGGAYSLTHANGCWKPPATSPPA